MGPKPIQDVTPPPQATSPAVEPPPGPEIVGDIPVRAPAGHATDEQKLQSPKNDESSFIVPAKPVPAAGKDNQKPKAKDSKPKPTLAIVMALLAAICLAVGAYFKFFSNS
ncbi:MAG: hypothetical protein Q7R60_01530 [bacterium]|nr:hypothetical protein [bacterium]